MKMHNELESTFLAALEQNEQKLLRVCSVYAKDEEDTKDLFQEVLTHIPTLFWKTSLTSHSGFILSDVCQQI